MDFRVSCDYAKTTSFAIPEAFPTGIRVVAFACVKDQTKNQSFRDRIGASVSPFLRHRFGTVLATQINAKSLKNQGQEAAKSEFCRASLNHDSLERT